MLVWSDRPTYQGTKGQCHLLSCLWTAKKKFLTVNNTKYATLYKTYIFPHPGGLFEHIKGAGVFGRPGQNMEDLFVFGTSRSSNELKSVPQPPCQLRLMKRYFWSHKISHLWLKIGLFKANFDLFLQVFCSTDHIYAHFKLEMDQELPYTYGKVG